MDRAERILEVVCFAGDFDGHRTERTPIFSKTPPPPLPEMTLLRGSRIGLPSGQETCRAAGLQPLTDAQIGFDDEGNEFLRDRGLNEKTPLWYYFLREAE